jgi:mitochondrial FAD-linked sulfhydryl oxidase
VFKNKSFMSCLEDICSEANVPTVIFKEGVEIHCPPSKENIGRFGWGLLHTIAAHYPDDPSSEWTTQHQRFFSSFGRVFPCRSCGQHFTRYVKNNPPQLDNRTSIMMWTCEAHNEVNRMLNKEIFPCEMEKLDLRWRKGNPPCTSSINNV